MLAKKPESQNNLTPISVIISARNECQNLKQFLPNILKQVYPRFEVVLVNDGSWDGTKDYLKELEREFAHLKVVELNIDERFHRGKKFALTMGMKAAQYQHFVFTDADCEPNSSHWLKSMINAYSKETDLVLGHSPVLKKATFTNYLSGITNTFTAIHYLSWAKANVPYMGVGRNLSYRKKVFFEGSGYSKHITLLSGDDDLFVNEHANAKNTVINIDPEAFMYTRSAENLKAYFTQKRRHFSVARFYRWRDKFHLGLYQMAFMLFYASLIGLIISMHQMQLVLTIIGVKTLVQWVIMGIDAAKLGEKRIAWTIPIADVLYLLQNIFLIPSIFYKPRSWK